MSMECWERGSIVIPGSQWKSLRDELAACHNTRQAQLQGIAQEAYRRLVMIKTMGGAAKLSAGVQLMCTDSRLAALFDPLHEHEALDVWRRLWTRDERGETALRRPLSADFRKVSAARCPGYATEDFRIELDGARRTLTWVVPETNQAVERARAHPLAKELFKRLGQMKWVRGTGGKIVGNDEYHREDTGAGGGANYVTARYGPLGRRDEPRRRAAAGRGQGGERAAQV